MQNIIKSLVSRENKENEVEPMKNSEVADDQPNSRVLQQNTSEKVQYVPAKRKRTTCKSDTKDDTTASKKKKATAAEKGQILKARAHAAQIAGESFL